MAKIDRSSFSPLSLTWPILIAILFLGSVLAATFLSKPQEGLTGGGSTATATLDPSDPTATAQAGTEPVEDQNANSSGDAQAAAKAGTPSKTPIRYYFPQWFHSVAPFKIQDSGILAVQSFTGCNWTGIAGQVFDLTGTPFKNLVVHLEGTWGGKSFSVDSISGSKQDYGPAGYQFVLGNQPLNSSGTLWIQLRDANKKHLSEPNYLTTYSDCARNLILVNFIQVH